jgi:cytoskeletal protein CcmA (bactofilin family)
MFGNKDTKTATPGAPTAPEARPAAGNGTSVLAGDTTFSGKLNCQSNMQVDGTYQGDIHVSGTLMVGREGKVNANVIAQRIVVHGRLEGNAEARGKIELMEGCTMIGEIKAPSLIIQDNVTFEGVCRMNQKANQKATA